MALLCISLAVYNVEYFTFAYWSFDDLWRNVLKPSAPMPSFPFICCCGDRGHTCLVVVLMVFIRDHIFTVSVHSDSGAPQVSHCGYGFHKHSCQGFFWLCCSHILVAVPAGGCTFSCSAVAHLYGAIGNDL